MKGMFMFAKKSVAMVVVAFVLLAGCVSSTVQSVPENILSQSVEKVSGKKTVNSYYFSNSGKSEYMFGKVVLSSWIVNDTTYLDVQYNSSNGWLFVTHMTARFEDSDKVYRIPFRNPDRHVVSGDWVWEKKTFKAYSGSVSGLTKEIIRRSKLEKPSKLFFRVDGEKYYDEAEVILPAGDYGLGGFLRHKGNPKQ